MHELIVIKRTVVRRNSAPTSTETKRDIISCRPLLSLGSSGSIRPSGIDTSACAPVCSDVPSKVSQTDSKTETHKDAIPGKQTDRQPCSYRHYTGRYPMRQTYINACN